VLGGRAQGRSEWQGMDVSTNPFHRRDIAWANSWRSSSVALGEEKLITSQLPISTLSSEFNVFECYWELPYRDLYAYSAHVPRKPLDETKSVLDGALDRYNKILEMPQLNASVRLLYLPRVGWVVCDLHCG
jgi:hypothetical protein